MHIIKTTASIPTKFYTHTKNYKVLIAFVQICPQPIQDGGRPPFWKTVKSRVVTLYLSEFVEPHGRRPDPDEYFSDARRAWTQLNSHHIAVQRQKKQVEQLQTQSQTTTFTRKLIQFAPPNPSPQNI